jgi:hypothetical protein
VSTTDFDGRLAARAREILDLISRSRWTLWRRVPRNPELRKNLDRLYTAIADARRLRRGRKLDDPTAALLLELLDVDPARFTADSLGQLLESVDQLLIAAGDELLIASVLETEYARDRLEGGGTTPTWSTLYAKEPLAASKEFAAGAKVTPTSLTEARRKLAALYRARHTLYALGRARSTTRAARLVWLAPVVAGLAAGLVVAVDLVAEETSWRAGLLVALAGAVGATLSGAYKLRDQLPRLIELRTFWYAFALQLPLGAVAGLFLWIVLKSGLVEVADVGRDWALEAAIAFAAGFSEPLLLKTVERVGALGDAARR